MGVKSSRRRRTSRKSSKTTHINVTHSILFRVNDIVTIPGSYPLQPWVGALNSFLFQKLPAPLGYYLSRPLHWEWVGLYLNCSETFRIAGKGRTASTTNRLGVRSV